MERSNVWERNPEIPEFHLDELQLPQDLRKLTILQCRLLAKEIRSLLIKVVSKNGGHLASNLGAVELTLALHRVFESPRDKFVWDVGHQCYTHKILTGRLEEFVTLRQEGGISGFPKPEESPHDSFISGHSSTSISVACGMATAMQLTHDPHHVIAIIGDGALTGGLAYEGFNNVGRKMTNLIVILNDNNMSISGNVGAMSRYLRSIRDREGYVRMKQGVERRLGGHPLGMPVVKALKSTKDGVKNMILHDEVTFFEQFGFVYLGPVDGHNQLELESVLRTAKRYDAPVLIHVKTVKGKGYPYAERNPSQFHGISRFDIMTGNPEVSGEDCYSTAFGKELCKLAREDRRICAITAAMKFGTGLQLFEQQFPDRFFDVGIAEQHAVTFAASLATSGMLPVFAVYSSFLQRAYDQLLHDAAISGAHMILGIDRAGVVGEDGETHHGMFDVPMLTSIPNTSIYAPACYEELRYCMRSAIERDKGIVAIRYPRGNDKGMTFPRTQVQEAFVHTPCEGASILLLGYGRIYESLYRAKHACKEIPTALLKLTKIYPIEEEIVDIAMGYATVLFFEEGREGISTLLASRLLERGYHGCYRAICGHAFLKQASVPSLLDQLGLSPNAVTHYLLEYGTEN